MKRRFLPFLIALLLGFAALPQVGAHIERGSVSPPSGGAPSSPTDVQVVMQGQTTPDANAFYNSLWGGPPSTGTIANPNNQELGWEHVTGATSYNILDNGVMVANVSDSTASTNYTSYVSTVSGTTCYDGNACDYITNVDRTYTYTGASNIVSGTIQSYPRSGANGNGGIGPVLNATGSINTGSSPGLHTLSIASFVANTIQAGQVINGAGLSNNACTVMNTSGSPPTETVNFTAGCTSGAETNSNIFIAGLGAFSGTGTWGAGTLSAITVTAIDPPAVYAGQGIGGPGIPVGAVIGTWNGSAWVFGGTCDGMASTGTGGAGTYCLSDLTTLALVAASGTETSQTYGTVYLVNEPHIMQVQAVNGSGTSASSSDAILPFIVNGGYICSGGVFSGGMTKHATAPATTPLGYSEAVEWNAPSVGIANTFALGSCSGYNVGVAGYNYIHFEFYTTQTGVTITAEPEIGGDGELGPVQSIASYGSSCSQPMTANTWNDCKIPLAGASGINIDGPSGLLGKSSVAQTSFYKITWGYMGTATAQSYYEIYFSVN